MSEQYYKREELRAILDRRIAKARKEIPDDRCINHAISIYEGVWEDFMTFLSEYSLVPKVMDSVISLKKDINTLKETVDEMNAKLNTALYGEFNKSKIREITEIVDAVLEAKQDKTKNKVNYYSDIVKFMVMVGAMSGIVWIVGQAALKKLGAM